MNNVTLTGRLTKDVELKVSKDTKFTNFNLAVNRILKKEGQPTADFVSCVAFGKTAELITQYLSQGSKVLVNGEIRTGSYKDKEGKTVYTTNVVVSNVEFLESKKATQPTPAEPVELPFM